MARRCLQITLKEAMGWPQKLAGTRRADTCQLSFLQAVSL